MITIAIVILGLIGIIYAFTEEDLTRGYTVLWFSIGMMFGSVATTIRELLL